MVTAPRVLPPESRGRATARSISPPDGLLPPRGEVGIGQHVVAQAGLARADGGAGRAAAALGVGPGDPERLQIAVLSTRMGHRSNASGFVLVGIADPHQA